MTPGPLWASPSSSVKWVRHHLDCLPVPGRVEVGSNQGTRKSEQQLGAFSDRAGAGEAIEDCSVKTLVFNKVSVILGGRRLSLLWQRTGVSRGFPTGGFEPSVYKRPWDDRNRAGGFPGRAFVQLNPQRTTGKIPKEDPEGGGGIKMR